MPGRLTTATPPLLPFCYLGGQPSSNVSGSHVEKYGLLPSCQVMATLFIYVWLHLGYGFHHIGVINSYIHPNIKIAINLDQHAAAAVGGRLRYESRTFLYFV